MSVAIVPNFIGGEFREPSSRDVQVDPIPDPATGETIAMLPYSSHQEIEQAIAAAHAA